MEERLLHVFRNTPFGRETLLQSLYFCNALGISLHIYIPEAKQFLLYFDHDAVQVDLDGSYLTTPATALENATRLAEKENISPTFLTPKNYTASQLPDIPTHYNYMCCPRSISDLSSKIGLGYIGPKVRRIVKSSSFPVLITSPSFKKWKSICVFYGGSNNANKALSWGISLSIQSGYPLDMFTYLDGRSDDYFDSQIEAAGLADPVKRHVRTWHKIKSGKFEEALYTADYKALLVVGAYGHHVIKELLFGSKMETIQSWMPNNILLVGPNCTNRGV